MNAFKILIVLAYFLQITAAFCPNQRTEPGKKKLKKNIQPALGLKDTLSRNASRANASAKTEAKRLISFVVGQGRTKPDAMILNLRVHIDSPCGEWPAR